jgi:hypothetical protein
VTETNAPGTGTFPATVTLNPAGQTVDGLSLVMKEIILGGGAEWVTWAFKTLNGLSIAGNINAQWMLAATGVQVSGLPTITNFFLTFGDNGILLNPTSNTGSNLSVETNPITGVGLVQGATFFFPDRTTVGGNATSGTGSFAGRGAGPHARAEHARPAGHRPSGSRVRPFSVPSRLIVSTWGGSSAPWPFILCGRREPLRSPAWQQQTHLPVAAWAGLTGHRRRDVRASRRPCRRAHRTAVGTAQERR